MRGWMFLLVVVFLITGVFGTAGDTIINVWGRLDYGWIDASTFGIRFQGSAQIHQIEQDWPKSALLITDHAHRFNDNLCAWQIRKSEGREILQVIPNDFTKGQAYTSEPPKQQTEGNGSYSEFQLVIPRVFDSYVLLAGGDPIEIRLCWVAQQPVFFFVVSVPPPAQSGEHSSTPETDETPSNDQTTSSSTPHSEDEPAPETEESRVSGQVPDEVIGSPPSTPSSLSEQEPIPKINESPSNGQAAEESSSVVQPPSPVVEDESVRGETPPEAATGEDREVQQEPLRSSYVQGETILYSFAPANPANNTAKLTVLQVNPGEAQNLVYFDAIPYDPTTGQFTIRLDTADLPTGSYELIIWITGEMEPHRARIEIISP